MGRERGIGSDDPFPLRVFQRLCVRYRRQSAAAAGAANRSHAGDGTGIATRWVRTVTASSTGVPTKRATNRAAREAPGSSSGSAPPPSEKNSMLSPLDPRGARVKSPAASRLPWQGGEVVGQRFQAQVAKGNRNTRSAISMTSSEGWRARGPMGPDPVGPPWPTTRHSGHLSPFRLPKVPFHL